MLNIQFSCRWSAALRRSCEVNIHSGKYTLNHYDDVIMTMLASQITSLTVVYSIVYSGVNQRKHQSSASLAFVREIHRGPVNFPHKWPVTRKMFPFDDVIMIQGLWCTDSWKSQIIMSHDIDTLSWRNCCFLLQTFGNNMSHIRAGGWYYDAFILQPTHLFTFKTNHHIRRPISQAIYELI